MDKKRVFCLAATENSTSRRTLVEFYDPQYLENVISLLRGSYADVVYVYFTRANEPTEQDRRALTEFVRNNFGFAVKKNGARARCSFIKRKYVFFH